jgi:hypothetical protein
MAAIEDTFSSEEVDSAWAPAAELALREVMQHANVAAFALVQAECRTTLCRLDLAGHAAPEGDAAVVEGFREVVGLLPWAGQSFGQIDMGEAPTAVLYLTRDGHVFPPMAEQQ